MIPSSPEAFLTSPLNARPWYYEVEVFPGVHAEGSFPSTLPMLPRQIARHADVSGQICLDIGSMEGLMPALLARRGAAGVLATDAVPHVADRMEALKAYYDVDFQFAQVGLLYNLHQTLAGQGFDFINFSGVLYHVYSPLMALASVRSLLKRNGLMTVSTCVVYSDGYTAEFNAHGGLQPEANTFWYLSVPLLDYMLRMLRLAPVDCLHFTHEDAGVTPDTPGLKTGYMSVLCQARDELLPVAGDGYLAAMAANSWEFGTLTDWARVDGHPASAIRQTSTSPDVVWRDDLAAVDLWASVQAQPSQWPATCPQDAHRLHLADRD